MRSIVIAAVMALGIGLVGVQASSAAPANGLAIGKAAAAGHVTEQAHWRYHHHRHCWVGRHGRLHCWW
jgi:hypothetical protein